MRIVVISDTHGQHRKLGTLRGDVLIHAGDMESLFAPENGAWQLDDIDDWFGQQDFDRIFCIGGNHDAELERRVSLGQEPFTNTTWLHESCIKYKGVTFYGASWVPMLPHLPFFADAKTLTGAWARIPDDVDVLVTHTPPLGVLDVSSRGKVLGCAHLAQRLKALSPALHCFGHVHNGAGQKQIGATTFANATNVNSQFRVTYPPFVFEIPTK
ncbi:MAG: metallophosphatase domain-containing protein [Pseudomonadota bacterium]